MNRRAQGILEYVVILGIVATALMAMSLYFRRGIQAAVKVATDEMGGQSDAETDPNKGTTTDSTAASGSSVKHTLQTSVGGSFSDQIDSTRSVVSSSTSVSKSE
jgi:hypothetical protein